MYTTRTAAQEAAEDIFFGQIVIIWARWFFILAGGILALWSARTTAELTAAVVVVVALMVINFFVHGRYLMERPANRMLLLATSLLDLLIITFLVLNWQGQGGLDSPFYILYYPMLFAFALVFTPRTTAAYTLLGIGLYLLVCFVADPGFLGRDGGPNLIIMRLITLAAMGGLGTFYWRIQRDRRRAALGTPSLRRA